MFTVESTKQMMGPELSLRRKEVELCADETYERKTVMRKRGGRKGQTFSRQRYNAASRRWRNSRSYFANTVPDKPSGLASTKEGSQQQIYGHHIGRRETVPPLRARNTSPRASNNHREAFAAALLFQSVVFLHQPKLPNYADYGRKIQSHECPATG
jgi:hypothetical protein